MSDDAQVFGPQLPEEGMSLELEEAEAPPSWFEDSFISYSDQVSVGSILVASDRDLHGAIDAAAVSVENRANFAYEVSLRSLDPWLVSDAGAHVLRPTESADLPIRVDRSRLVPGIASGSIEVRMEGAFFSRSYPVKVHGEVEFRIPVPLIEVEPLGAEPEVRLSIRVRNGGAGLLRGHFYDRALNEHQSFLLAGSDEPEADEEGGGAVARTVFQTTRVAESRRFRNFVVSSDTAVTVLRVVDINADDYVTAERITSVAFIDFMRSKPDRAHTFDISLEHPDFRKAVEVVIPPRLEPVLSAQAKKSPSIRFHLHESFGRFGTLVDHVEFVGRGGRRVRIPVLISQAQT